MVIGVATAITVSVMFTITCVVVIRVSYTGENPKPGITHTGDEPHTLKTITPVCKTHITYWGNHLTSLLQKRKRKPGRVAYSGVLNTGTGTVSVMPETQPLREDDDIYEVSSHWLSTSTKGSLESVEGG